MRELRWPIACYLLSVCLCLIFPRISSAQVPKLIRYQGFLKDSQGVPLQGPYKLTFRLYAASTGGTALWTEEQLNVPIDQGNFSVLLGGQNTSLSTFDWSAPSWLSVQVNVDAELSPRQQITSVPLAIRSETAEQLANPVTTSTITDDGYRLVPSGAIILWTGAACPAGYVRVSSMDNKFLVSGSAFSAAAGGSNTHTHGAGSYAGPNHTHTIPRDGWGEGVSSISGRITSHPDGVLRQATQDNTSGNSGTGAVTGTSAPADSRPEFATILLCQKT